MWCWWCRPLNPGLEESDGLRGGSDRKHSSWWWRWAHSVLRCNHIYRTSIIIDLCMGCCWRYEHRVHFCHCNGLIDSSGRCCIKIAILDRIGRIWLSRTISLTNQMRLGPWITVQNPFGEVVWILSTGRSIWIRKILIQRLNWIQYQIERGWPRQFPICDRLIDFERLTRKGRCNPRDHCICQLVKWVPASWRIPTVLLWWSRVCYCPQRL